MESVDNLIDILMKSSSTPGKPFLANLLKEMRRTKINRPDIVLQHGPSVLKSVAEAEKWNIVEQIFLAAIDVGADDIAQNYLKLLVDKFPKSARVGRLRGMFAEVHKEYEQALSIYNAYLTEQPGNIPLMKRKIAVYKSKGASQEELKELLNVVTKFPFDTQTWIELASLYLTNGDLEQAVHCYEETILLEPTNPHYHTRLAEAYYSMGDFNHVLLARKHFTISLTMLAPAVNLRALYGLYYACRAISDDNTSDGKAKKANISASGVTNNAVNEELLSWAKDSMDSIKEATAEGLRTLHSSEIG